MTEPIVQKAYTAITKQFVQTGRAPHFTELAEMMGIKPEEARDLQRKAADAAVACWIARDTDYIQSWAPFSNIPSQYLITVDGEQKWYGQ